MGLSYYAELAGKTYVTPFCLPSIEITRAVLVMGFHMGPGIILRSPHFCSKHLQTELSPQLLSSPSNEFEFY